MISLMVSKAISENSPLIDASTQNTNASLLSSSGNPLALTLSTSESVMSSSSFSQESNEVYTPQEVVATLGFLVGIFQVAYNLLMELTFCVTLAESLSSSLRFCLAYCAWVPLCPFCPIP